MKMMMWMMLMKWKLKVLHPTYLKLLLVFLLDPTQILFVWMIVVELNEVVPMMNLYDTK